MTLLTEIKGTYQTGRTAAGLRQALTIFSQSDRRLRLFAGLHAAADRPVGFAAAFAEVFAARDLPGPAVVAGSAARSARLRGAGAGSSDRRQPPFWPVCELSKARHLRFTGAFAASASGRDWVSGGSSNGWRDGLDGVRLTIDGSDERDGLHPALRRIGDIALPTRDISVVAPHRRVRLRYSRSCPGWTPWGRLKCSAYRWRSRIRVVSRAEASTDTKTVPAGTFRDLFRSR